MPVAEAGAARSRACRSSSSTTTTSPTALRAAVARRGRARASTTSPAPGELTIADLARALGWYSVPVPELAVDAAAELVARLPFLPAEAQWIEAVRAPVLMDTAKARRELRLAAAPRRSRDAAADGRRRALRAADQMTRCRS